MSNIYKMYKERLVEISGKNKSLFSKRIGRQYSYDIGKLLQKDPVETDLFLKFLMQGKRTGYTLLCKDFKDKIYNIMDIAKKVESKFVDKTNMSTTEARDENLRRERLKREETKKALIYQVNSLKMLKREVDEFAKETGRYEMFIGYPFVQGQLDKDTMIKAPLLLFPMEIIIKDEFTVDLVFKKDEPIQLNKVFILAYAKHYKLVLDNLIQEFDNSSKFSFKTIEEVLDYLQKFGFNLSYKKFDKFEDFELGGLPERNDKLSIRNYCVIGRFPLANSIYNDYTQLEKEKLTTPAIDMLLKNKSMPKNSKTIKDSFPITESDYSQEKSIENINQNGNVVIFGPPGTGKSQSIVNIISDSIAKHKKVLVVSQKKVAMDVVYNRLGTLANKVMYITDVEKNKTTFYDKIKRVHNEIMASEETDCYQRHLKNQNDINEEINHLQELSDVLFTKLPYGATLQELYLTSSQIEKGSFLDEIYKKLIVDDKIMSINYQTLKDITSRITEKKKDKLFFRFEELKKKNIFINYLKSDINLQNLNAIKNYIKILLEKGMIPFDFGKYHILKPVLFYLLDNDNDIETSKKLIKVIVSSQKDIAKKDTSSKTTELEEQLVRMQKEIKETIKDDKLLKKVLTKEGYSIIVENILNGSTYSLQLLLDTLNSYSIIKDMEFNLKSLNDLDLGVLNFIYKNSKTEEEMVLIAKNLLTMRNYFEIVKIEEKDDNKLSFILDYENTKQRIINLKTEALETNKEMAYNAFNEEYKNFYNQRKDSNDYLYVINKQENMWQIRKLMDYFSDYLLKLFPCWLLSPENVSSIIPLKQNLFDIIVFDEASQIFIENSIPTIYRGKYVAIAGDRKQLKPTATFMKRYIGNENFDDLSLSEQAALEVESLLDLATSRYENVYLNYHYRSKYEELINFSNYAFYDEKLQVSPNITKNVKKPIERIKVDGIWQDRKNHAEAVEVVKTIKKIFNERKHKETIGVITFNTEQEHYIADIIDIECEKDPEFREAYLKEANRRENGEDVGIFIKNIENVQGEERDIIIFSVGYAKNERGRVVALFGPLSMEGGENRLNVAITRAREKIYLITSIEPEELNVTYSKNIGPKIFKKYLQYARAVNYGNKYEEKIILESLRKKTIIEESFSNKLIDEIKKALEEKKFEVDTNIGNTPYKIDLGIYDKKLDRYVLGIELDSNAYKSSENLLERDVYRTKFLTSRGWNMTRIWSRDWWTDKERTIDLIINKYNKALEKIISESKTKKRKNIQEIECSVEKKYLNDNLFEKSEKESSVISSRLSKKILQRLEEDKENEKENEEKIKALNENPNYNLIIEPLPKEESNDKNND